MSNAEILAMTFMFLLGEGEGEKWASVRTEGGLGYSKGMEKDIRESVYKFKQKYKKCG